MRKSIAFLLLLSGLIGYSQEKAYNYKQYSYTVLFNMINAEQDSIFTLKNALIKYDLAIDTLFMTARVKNNPQATGRKQKLVIDKELRFENVHFQNHIFFNKDNNAGYLGNIHFKKKVTFRNSASIAIIDCEFDDLLIFSGTGEFCQEIGKVEQDQNISDYISITNSVFNNSLRLFYNCNFQDDMLTTNISLRKNTFFSNKDVYAGTSLSLIGRNFGLYLINENVFTETSLVDIDNNAAGIIIVDNDFSDATVLLNYNKNIENGKFEITGNQFNNTLFLGIPKLNETHILPIIQFKKGFISLDAFSSYYFLEKKDPSNTHLNFNNFFTSEAFIEKYLNTVLVENGNIYEIESSVLGRLYD